MLDLNDAQAQRTGNSNPIPPGSIVFVRLEIRKPAGDKQTDNPHVTRAKNGENNYLNCEFTVLSPTFEGRKMWNNYVVSGSQKACDISRSFLRAAIEAHWNISPNDDSPRACEARKVEGYQSFDGLAFPVLVGIAPSSPGDKYINNTLEKVITPEMEEYKIVQSQLEIITNNPVPALIAPPAAISGNGGGGFGMPSAAPATQPMGMPSSPANSWPR